MSSPEVDLLLVDDHESAHQARPPGPCATPDPAADRRAVGMPPPRSSPRPPRLLIVDDDLGAIEVLVRTLAPIGECHFATTGEEAMLLAARLRPDAILLDGQMPGVDGFAVCAKLKAWPAFESVPIVFVTGFADPANEKRALDLGAADFIAKPYTPELLRARVRNLLGWVQAARQADAELQAARAQRSAADAAGRRTTLMMSCIAHEMGNPLNGLLGFAELMVSDLRHPLAPAQAKRVEHIASSGRQLQGLMHDVMDLGRFEGAELRIDLCALDASACVRIAADAVAALADQAGVSLVANHGSSSICCAADADRLHQCLLNLLSNAIKYSRPGGSVQIEVRQALHEVAIAVRDDGLGMSAAQRQQLFEPFNRLGRQHSAAPGSGLGLVITRHLVRAMNGQLRIDSEPGVGSCFTIVLPAALDTAVT